MDDGIESSEREKSISKTFIIGLILIFVVIGITLFLNLNTQGYKYKIEVAGVPVYSKIPLDDFAEINVFFLKKNPDMAATICNLELSAVSDVKEFGYRVLIESGNKGIYIGNSETYIRGDNYDEILMACHSFICLNKGINCSEDMYKIVGAIIKKRVANVIIGENISGAGLRGYAEIMGALGYLQAAQLRDLNRDSIIDKNETRKTLILILPYIQNGTKCDLKPITTRLQKYNQTNTSVDCYIVTPSIRLVKSDKRAIRFENGDLILEGSDEDLNTESIIVRDIIAPEFYISTLRIS
ncbi:MAG TPA: hypothetical protein EYP86_02145 [Candidatus Altiarchaeales archaeon]|nr:hypothetical protein [Candidatus Altiarchaeales archaeon]